MKKGVTIINKKESVTKEEIDKSNFLMDTIKYALRNCDTCLIQISNDNGFLMKYEVKNS